MPQTDLLAPPVPELVALTPTDALVLTDDELIGTQRRLAERRRVLDASSSIIAAEIAHRSRRELGYDGLAQRRGARTAEALVQQITGLSGVDARTLVRVGALVVEHDGPSRSAVEPTTPWLSAVARSVASGALSLEAANAIRCGLGAPNESVSIDSLTVAAQQLVAAAAGIPLERLAALARRLRDELDEAGIAEREEHRRDRRYLALTALADGMTRISGLLDPESAAIVVGAVDAITSPRRGGPRFVDATQPAPLLDDTRTLPQVTLDALVDLVRVATLADTGTVLGARRVGVRLHVTSNDLGRGAGAARFEGQPDAVSVATAARHACEAGVVPVLFDTDGQVVNLGRNQRLFTSRQRIGLAARDGGCRFPDCDRPPTFTEAHHIVHWQRDLGRTDLRDGILLCRHHHLIVHNNGWEIERHRATYSLLPPPGLGMPTRVDMPARNSLAGARQP